MDTINKEAIGTETNPGQTDGKVPENTPKDAKKGGLLKKVKDAVVTAYTAIKTNPVGRVVLKVGKIATGALIVKTAYDKGVEKGKQTPVVVTITEGVQEEQVAESEPSVEAEEAVPEEESENQENVV